jgi:hydrogenase maturation protease
VTRDVRVLGIGNTLMGDDGVGSVVAHRLSEVLPGDVTVVVGETAGFALAPHFDEADTVIVVDALDADEEPGAVFRFDPDRVGSAKLRSDTSHGIGLPYIMLSARLRGTCPDVIVYAVQVGDVRPVPDTLSPAVQEAVPDVVEMVRAEVLSLLAEDPRASGTAETV